MESVFLPEISGQVQARPAHPRLSRDFPFKNLPTAVPSDANIPHPNIELPMIRLTKRYRVILLFDGDVAGRAASDDCIKRLARRIFVKAVELPEEKQPDMLTADELQLVL